jgi:uncharacterized membrane protein YphA (DoxX/SURF4 family)
MSKSVVFVRFVLGLIFLTSGLNGFFHFFAMPAMPDAANNFLGALSNGIYFFPLLKTLEMFCGAFLLIDAFVPLVLVVLAPIVVNIFMFHLFLAPSGLFLALILLFSVGYLSFFAQPYASIVKHIFHNPTKEEIRASKLKIIRIS